MVVEKPKVTFAIGVGGIDIVQSHFRRGTVSGVMNGTKGRAMKVGLVVGEQIVSYNQLWHTGEEYVWERSYLVRTYTIVEIECFG